MQDKASSKDAARAMADLATLCDFGGRFSGTDSEAKAIAWLKHAGEEALGASCKEHPFSYRGWRANRAELYDGAGKTLTCHPLVRSLPTPANGLDAEVLDVGRGLEEDFKKHQSRLEGRIVLFRHEVMFSTGTFHRRQKLRLAREAGAVGALVAGRESGEVVTGSSRGEGEPGIPAMGIAPEGAMRLQPAGGQLARARMLIEAEEYEAQSSTLIFDFPGESKSWVVLSAHVDGHDISESAMDNASGVVACLEVARRIRAAPRRFRHGLLLAFFSVEEWGLTGSEKYLESLSQQDLDTILLNINLDTVAGGRGLSALTSGFVRLESFVKDAAAEVGIELAVHLPLQRNSDHASFAVRGIPAFRLLSGFDEPDADVRYVLTGQDNRDRVRPEALARSIKLATRLTEKALDTDESVARGWRSA